MFIPTMAFSGPLVFDFKGSTGTETDGRTNPIMPLCQPLRMTA